MVSRLYRRLRPAVACGLLVSQILAASARADTFSVTSTSWGEVGTAGTFAWAIDQANNSLATGNVISITPNLLINVDGATAIDAALDLTEITRSVTILGNNATLVGNPTFITSGGSSTVVTKYNPQPYLPGDVTVTPSFSFAKIGRFGQDNTGINVTMSGLNADGLNRFALLERGAALTFTSGSIVNSVNFLPANRGITPGFDASRASLTLDHVVINRAYGLDSTAGGLIAGSDSRINVSNTTVVGADSGPVFVLAGGTGNVVSSVFDGSGGVLATGGSTIATGTVNVVNSVAFLAGPLNGGANDSFLENRFLAGDGGTINLTASTVIADLVSLQGRTAEANGVPLDADGGKITLASSAVLVTTYDADGFGTQIGFQTSNGGSFAADAFSWVQPTPAQSAADLKVLFGQPSLLTGSPGLPVIAISTSPLIQMTPRMPQASYPYADGVLIGVVPDADGANRLIDPIDGSTITVDVYGYARTTGGTRNVGAVEALQTTVPEVGPGSSFGGGAALLLAALAWLEQRRRIGASRHGSRS
jgi:hypothetical protein